MWCGCGTPLARKSSFFPPSADFYSLQNIPGFYCSLRHVLTSTMSQKSGSYSTKYGRTQTWWVGRNKNFFSSFSTRSQKYELFAFWQQQQSRLAPCDWSIRKQWNGVEWQTVHMRGRSLVQMTTHGTWFWAMNGLSREKIPRKKARIMPLCIVVKQQGQTETRKLREKKKVFSHHCDCPRIFGLAWVLKNIYVNSLFWGKANSNKSHPTRIYIYVRFKLPAVWSWSRKPVRPITCEIISLGPATFFFPKASLQNYWGTPGFPANTW